MARRAIQTRYRDANKRWHSAGGNFAKAPTGLYRDKRGNLRDARNQHRFATETERPVSKRTQRRRAQKKREAAPPTPRKKGPSPLARIARSFKTNMSRESEYPWTSKVKRHHHKRALWSGVATMRGEADYAQTLEAFIAVKDDIPELPGDMYQLGVGAIDPNDPRDTSGNIARHHLSMSSSWGVAIKQAIDKLKLLQHYIHTVVYEVTVWVRSERKPRKIPPRPKRH